jgi:hypothetical protein
MSDEDARRGDVEPFFCSVDTSQIVQNLGDVTNPENMISDSSLATGMPLHSHFLFKICT